jgi:ATP-dependent helicase/nuclease subunit B
MMPGGPQVYSIAAHRGFADALVAGLIPRYSEPEVGLARLTLLLPSSRAARTVTEAFVRASGGGMLMPRMAVVGDLDLDETLGSLLDPLGAGAAIPPAANPTRRLFRLTQFLAEEWREADSVPGGAALLRLAQQVAASIDRLLVENIDPATLWQERVLQVLADQAQHWAENTRRFARVHSRWQSELVSRGEIDAATRRNR